MDFQSLINSAKATASNAVLSASELIESATTSVGSGVGYATQALSNSWLFGSNEVTDSEFDEKHYFLIPFQPAERGYSLYSMRCLPDGVPPINDLPKKRIFHLPNENAATMVELLLCDEASRTAASDLAESPTAARLTDLADRIDELDQKAFHGALLIGGLVALANPVAGGILAAKAMVPSIGLVLAKYGLKQASDTLDDRSLQSGIKTAQKKVLAEFNGKSATLMVDKLLAQLDKALNTTEVEHDPILGDPILGDPLLDGAPEDALDPLAATAIVNTYEATLCNKKLWAAAGLGPEDIRWLKMLATIIK